MALLLSACTALPRVERHQHPLGYSLPPGAPNLYENAIVERFHLVARRPFRVNGVTLAPWLVATVLDEPVYGRSMGRATHEERVLLVHRVGYLMDTRNRAFGRILAIVETVIDPATQHRRIQFWLDVGWVRGGAASGEWSPPRATTQPVTIAEATVLMRPVHLLVARGYIAYAKANGLPVPSLMPAEDEQKEYL
jgi:hypothetical protein